LLGSSGKMFTIFGSDPAAEIHQPGI